MEGESGEQMLTCFDCNMHHAIKLGDGLNHKRQKYKCNEKSSKYLVQKQSPAAGNNLVKLVQFLPRDAMLSPRIYLSVRLSVCHVLELYPGG